MALRRRRGIVGLSVAFLVMILGVGAYELWLHMGLRDHPWQLESYLDILIADCRTGPGAQVFAMELRGLNSLAEEARSCLAQVDKAGATGRDFTPCLQKLLDGSLTALRVRILKGERLHQEKSRLDVFLKLLETDLSQDLLARQSGAKFEIRSLAQSQARTRVEEARNLAALGQSQSALIALHRARSAWGLSEDHRAAELSRFYEAAQRARWERQAQDLLRWTKQSGRSAILVDKLEHRCLLLAQGRIKKTYVANLGRNWYRNKVQERDASTPEGQYRIQRKFRSASFGWALLLDYPNAADRQRFNVLKKSGEIGVRARIGGNIEIHGGGRLNSDWTDGCVSLENGEMADLYQQAYAGMPVTIVGTCSLGAASRE